MTDGKEPPCWGVVSPSGANRGPETPRNESRQRRSIIGRLAPSRARSGGSELPVRRLL
jgi:hypothetical protein